MYRTKMIQGGGFNPLNFFGKMKFDQDYDSSANPKENMISDPEDDNITMLLFNYDELFVKEVSRVISEEFMVRLREEDMNDADQNIKSLKPIYERWEEFDPKEEVDIPEEHHRRRGRNVNPYLRSFPNRRRDKQRKLVQKKQSVRERWVVRKKTKQIKTHKKNRNLAELLEYDGFTKEFEHGNLNV